MPGSKIPPKALQATLQSSAAELRRWAIELTIDMDLIWYEEQTIRLLTISQAAIGLLFLCLTLGNEILDVPHYVFNNSPTSYSQRFGEIIIELFIFFTVMTIQILLFKKLYKRIRILEGFIAICANCKKIRNTEDQWEQMEKYIAQHSLAHFSHSICPDCARQLYPDFYNDKMKIAQQTNSADSTKPRR